MENRCLAIKASQSGDLAPAPGPATSLLPSCTTSAAVGTPGFWLGNGRNTSPTHRKVESLSR